MSGLPAGSYDFYFGIDTDRNRRLDLDQLYYDSVKVDITGDVHESRSGFLNE
jgi:hypothetical protein